MSARDVDNMASTGSGARPVVRVGRLYGHSIQALGARHLFPDATVALEVDGNEIRCVLLGDASGQMRRVECDDHLLGELARRAVVDLDEPTAPAAGARLPECLVTRAAILLGSAAMGGKAVLTGDTVLDTEFLQRLWSRLLALQGNVSLLISPEAIFAGAFGAAILAARRVTRTSRPFVSRLHGSIRRESSRGQQSVAELTHERRLSLSVREVLGMEPMPPDDTGAVRDALAVVDTSIYLIRKHLGDLALADEYLAKHLSRMEESVRRASAALEGE